jgi:hypothetical protein
MKNDDSYVEVGSGGTTFVGPDATRLFAAISVRSALNLYLQAQIKANRAYTPKNMVAFVTGITGKTYNRGRSGQIAALHDLGLWIAAMKSALPVEGDRK